MTLISQEIPRVLFALSQEPWTKTKYIYNLNDQVYISNKLQYHSVVETGSLKSDKLGNQILFLPFADGNPRQRHESL